MSKTPTQFVNAYNGKAIDFDHGYGVQCVDGFRVFCSWAFGKSWPTGNGWADGYWYSRNQHLDCFTPVGANQLRNGDWVIWARGSKSHPSSHIAMYYDGKEFGENQGGNRGFCLKNTTFSDALGALRPKCFPVGRPAKPATNTGASTRVAHYFSKTYAKTYTTTANLNLRIGSSTKDAVIVVMPKGAKFTCYGYYNTGWLYGVTVINGRRFTGFASKTYLR